MRSIIATPPGATIEEQIKEKGLTFEGFASRMSLSIDQAESLLVGEFPVTPQIAQRLETIFGVPAIFWLNLEEIYVRKKMEKNHGS